MIAGIPFSTCHEARWYGTSATATARKQTPYFHQAKWGLLQSIPNSPYLGVTLSTVHLNTNVAKSYQCLDFVRSNQKYCPEKLRHLSYISLIRSKLEYSGSVCDPHLRNDMHQLEMVQHRAARFIKHDNSYDSSVSQMLKYISTYHPWKTKEK